MAQLLHHPVIISNIMRLKFLIIPSIFMFQAAVAQSDSAQVSPAVGAATTPVSAATSTAVTPGATTPAAGSSSEERTKIMDYKSVYETASVEEEVQLATERFSLTAEQQDIWLVAARDRRQSESFARGKLDSNDINLSKEGVYRGLKAAQSTFYETVIGYLTPVQKQQLESDRVIINEKQKRLAKLPPPPPPPAPVDTMPAIDSTAVKAADLDKDAGKKGKKSKKKN